MSTSTFSRPVPKDGDVGKVLTPAVIENNYDVDAAAQGKLAPESIRRVEVAEALVDTGATSLCLPPDLIQALGLYPIRQASARPAGGLVPLTLYSAVNLTIQGRSVVVQVTSLPEGSPVLIGQVPLELLDLVPFPKEQKLLPNPAHGNEWIIDIY
ncbi:MAG TPA: aspartyl protease family protein [Isosphaeraceae bacterium]|jgi:predicted aspartyl protease|nr:aspartyl protease family protein [Isosphaeraceae bacterium]